MAKTRTKRRKPLKQKPLSPDEIQVANIEFCEDWLGGLPKMSGVGIARALSYELCRMLNQVEAQPETKAE